NLLAGNIYCNIHTPAFPGGEIRGQFFEQHLLVAAEGAGGSPQVNVYDVATHTLKASFLAFDSTFTGGVRVAVADVDPDGTEDVFVAAGPSGGPHIKVIDGTKLNQVGPNGEIVNSALLASFFAFGADFRGGLFVAAGDLNGDKIPDIVVGADAGAAPHVK